jgi:hypothetical protein
MWGVVGGKEEEGRTPSVTRCQAIVRRSAETPWKYARRFLGVARFE